MRFERRKKRGDFRTGGRQEVETSVGKKREGISGISKMEMKGLERKWRQDGFSQSLAKSDKHGLIAAELATCVGADAFKRLNGA